MIIAHNLGAMNAQRQYNIVTNRKAKSSEKLSSGYKINRAADDAAGLSISEKMRRQIRGLTQGVENTQDGVSLCQVADGALAEVNDMLHRITELSVKSANGTNSEQDRQYIQEEINQILQEIERIGDTTTFNEQHIFSGGEAKSTYLPPTVGNIGVSGTPTDATAMTYNITADENGFSINGDAFTWSSFSNGANTLADTPISSGTYTFDYHGLTISLTAEQDAKIEDLVGRMDGASFATKKADAVTVQNVSISPIRGSYLNLNSPLPSNANIEIRADRDGVWVEVDGNPYIGKGGSASDYKANWGESDQLYWHEYAMQKGSANPINLTADATSWCDPSTYICINDNISFDDFIATLDHAQITVSRNNQPNINISYTPYSYEITDIKLNAQTISANDKIVLGQVKQTNYKGIEIPPTQEEIDNAPLSLWIQSGCEAGDGMYLEIDPMNTNILDIDDLDVSTVEGANHAMDAVKGALQKITENRSKIGAQQNRLEHTIANEENIVENTTAAESRIRDTDMAKTMVEYSNTNILLQAGQAMMAQANQSNQGVLNLLG